MKLTVFLVEDETPTRNGIRENVPWDLLELNYVGEARNGEEAYSQILDLQPDIVITDIKMPMMNGIDLSARIRDALPRTKIIFISAYDEFSFAQKAIDLGVRQYVLKPITPKKMISALQKVKILHQDEILERRRGFRENLGHPVSFPSAEDALDSRISDKWICAVVADAVDEKAFFGLVPQYRDNAFIVFFDGSPPGCFILGESLEECRDKAYRFIGGIDEEVIPPSTRFSISDVVRGTSEGAELYRRALKTQNHRYLLEGARVSSYPELEQLLSRNRSLVCQESDSLVDFILEGDPSGCRAFVEDRIRSPKSIRLGMRFFLIYTAVDFLAVLTDFLMENVGNPEEAVAEFADPDTVLESCTDIDATIDALTPVLMYVVELRDRIRSPYYQVMQKARADIEEHYSDSQYSLIRCAATCGMSPAHFSTVFKQTMQISFIKYLTRIRMDRAKYLLRSTSLQALEIAREVGYRDSHYFSFVFRKNLELTPTAYRNGSEAPERIGG